MDCFIVNTIFDRPSTVDRISLQKVGINYKHYLFPAECHLIINILQIVLSEYDFILGAYNKNQNHWNLFVSIEFKIEELYLFYF